MRNWILIGFFVFSILDQLYCQLSGVEIEILGIAQDAGYPQIDCQKSCCASVWEDSTGSKSPVALGVYDHDRQKSWLVEATPEIKWQWNRIVRSSSAIPSGILITHAHIGHYSGLLQLGREAMNARNMPIYILPRMAGFLTNNGPWKLLLDLGNITLNYIHPDSTYQLSEQLSYMPLLVPHRDEFSETAAFIFIGPTKRLLFVPDIDKWSKWDRNIIQLIQTVDYALIDGTFFENGELPNRDISEIPHPFIIESLSLFENLSVDQRDKIYFIHFNHTNPLVREEPVALQKVLKRGMHVSQEGMKFKL
ncbi:MAG: pyrroloquinoline quinone biosynthesis protein PqqB [Saprospiraceae bacterium]|nr:pyrroloquinoline quinone biosynthesis protein PqqB [Saprospiraceae bacterium]